jgi:CBS domain-containing protein
MLRVRDIMSPSVVTLAPDTSIREAAEILTTERIGGAPVVVHGELIGMLTSQDLMDFIASLASEPPEVRDRTERGILDDHVVEEAMTRAPLRTVAPSAPAQSVAELLSLERMHRIPVVEEGRVVGIVSTMDVVRAVAERRIGHATLVFPSRSSLS